MTFTSLHLADGSRQLLERYLKQPAHALLLEGPVGIGLFTTAKALALQLGTHQADIRLIQPDAKRTITIDSIRSLYALTRARHSTPRVIIIDDAERMGQPAQNALLKLLEEPGAQTYFILTSHLPHELLPTILSRVQRAALRPLSAAGSESLITASTNKVKRTQLLFLARGLPAELARLQANEKYFAERLAVMTDARKFLEGDTFERLVIAGKYSAGRSDAQRLLDSLLTLLTFTFFSRREPALATQLELVDSVLERLEANAHARTQLTYLVSHLG